MPEPEKTDPTELPEAAPRPSASVHRLASMVRLVRDRTDRSKCYDDMYRCLSEDDQSRVDRLEAKLFQSDVRVEHCPQGKLSLPEADRTFDDGRLYFHYSPDQQRFVLNYFELWGGGGGLSSGAPTPCRSLSGFWQDSLVPDGIAARLDHYFHKFDFDLVAELSMMSFLPPSAERWHQRCADLLEESSSVRKSTTDVVRQICQAHLVWADRESAWTLPEWSVLSTSTSVREEIENPYARAAFAGEALCRLSIEFSAMGPGGRILAWGPTRGVKRKRIYSWPSQRGLFNESLMILGAIRDRQTATDLRNMASHFLTASLMDRELLTDDRRLTLVRSEMTYRLASALQKRASTIAHCKPAHRWGLRRDLIHRYAMLSEFVATSAAYFGDAAPSATAMDIVNELDGCQQRERATLRGMVKWLYDFGSTTTLIVTHFSENSPLPPVHPGDVELPALHDRLSALVGCILGSDGRAQIAKGKEESPI